MCGGKKPLDKLQVIHEQSVASQMWSAEFFPVMTGLSFFASPHPQRVGAES